MRVQAVHPGDGPRILPCQAGEVRGAVRQEPCAVPEAQLGRSWRGEQSQAPARPPLVVGRQRALLHLPPKQLGRVVHGQDRQPLRLVRRVPKAHPRRHHGGRARRPFARLGLRLLGHVPAAARGCLVFGRDFPLERHLIPWGGQALQADRLGLDHRVAPVPRPRVLAPDLRLVLAGQHRRHAREHGPQILVMLEGRHDAGSGTGLLTI